MPRIHSQTSSSRSMQVRHACSLLRLDILIHCHAWVYITCQEIPAKTCQWKEISFYPIINLYFNQEPIKLQHGPVKTKSFPHHLLTLRFEECRRAIRCVDSCKAWDWQNAEVCGSNQRKSELVSFPIKQRNCILRLYLKFWSNPSQRKSTRP